MQKHNVCWRELTILQLYDVANLHIVPPCPLHPHVTILIRPVNGRRLSVFLGICFLAFVVLPSVLDHRDGKDKQQRYQHQRLPVCDRDELNGLQPGDERKVNIGCLLVLTVQVERQESEPSILGRPDLVASKNGLFLFLVTMHRLR